MDILTFPIPLYWLLIAGAAVALVIVGAAVMVGIGPGGNRKA